MGVSSIINVEVEKTLVSCKDPVPKHEGSLGLAAEQQCAPRHMRMLDVQPMTYTAGGRHRQMIPQNSTCWVQRLCPHHSQRLREVAAR